MLSYYHIDDYIPHLFLPPPRKVDIYRFIMTFANAMMMILAMVAMGYFYATVISIAHFYAASAALRDISLFSAAFYGMPLNA